MVTVIVPVYKVEKYLNKCISSIVNQSYHNLEIILVDDGSPDQCGDICDEWALRDNRIRVIHKKNGGLSDARNVGIQHATGEYLCFVDSDDYLEMEMIERLLTAIIQANAKIAICNFVYEFEDEKMKFIKGDSETLSPLSYQISDEIIMTGKEILQQLAERKYLFCEVAWNKLYCTEIFSKLRYPKGKIHEDEFLFHKIMYSCQCVTCISFVGYHYLQRKGSIMSQGIKLMDSNEAYLDRCIYFMERNEETLTVLYEKKLYAFMRSMQKELPRKEIKSLKRMYFKLTLQMYRRKWISSTLFLKRFICCWIL